MFRGEETDGKMFWELVKIFASSWAVNTKAFCNYLVSQIVANWESFL